MLLRLLVVLAPAYILSQFLRNSVAVLAPNLSQDLGIGSAGLGTLTGAFFLSFAFMQLPVGMALDRFGPRRVMASLLAVVGAGCVVFAFADSAPVLLLGRILMGMGCAPLLMGAMVVFARAFAPERFASLTAMHLAIGNTGILLATSPLAMMVDLIDWRGTFFGAGLLAGLFAVLMVVTLPEQIRGKPLSSGRSEGITQSLMGVGRVIADRRLWPLMPMLFTGYGSVAAMTALWGGPYLADIYGLNPIDRGNVLLLMAVGSILGPICYAPLDRRFNTRKWVVVPGCALVMGIFGLLAIWGRPPFWLLPILLFLISAGNGYFSVSMAHARSLYPDHALGRGMTVSNMLVMGGVGLLQPMSGLVAGLFTDGATGAMGEPSYRAVFAFLGVSLGLSLAFYLKAPDCPPYKKSPSDKIKGL
ncbi:MFS transporter [Iodidimonas gelatinilytica]|uniref:MFS transporter n=1 Tax=Iodidimonas gelatinilytica TaxID=1236966 RepID=A0A5A7MVA8_9PROT|nr:MFS transporter [Iodidimonas gelatinilytica]GEQ99932.1 MFS transporter [Iodidimonas gelatinilytica]